MNPLRSIASTNPDTEAPIRAELFGRERFEQHAESLARAQTVYAPPTRGRKLMPRVLDNARVLLESYHAVAQAIHQKQAITPAEEWLIDNFHIVEEQIREIRDDLPSNYYRQLPKLSSGHLIGYPRVYGVAWAFVAHTDSQFDPEALKSFIDAYQRVEPLTIGELWAVAISLRIILVENLRRVASQIVRSRIARSEADALADRLLKPEEEDEVASSRGLLDLIERTPLAAAFTVQLVQRLRDLRPRMRPLWEFLEQRLAAQETSTLEVVRAEHQSQAAASATVRNIITSMRLISAFDWSQFFESVSLVDATLRARSDFAAMDFDTRDSYRHAIEQLSRGSGIPELTVSQRALDRAARARATTASPELAERVGDPGYSLIGEGREPFERELRARVSLRQRALRLYRKTALPGYIGSITLVTALVTIPPLLHAWRTGAGGLELLMLALFVSLPASGLAIALVNRAVTHLLGPRTLPRLALKEGVPAHLRTLVVVPTLLTSRAAVDDHIELLEVHYLSNADGDLRFALLSDWADAPTEAGLASDDELLGEAAAGVAGLNRRHGPAPGGGDRFLLLHRRRVWSETERCWMGWERKRGKLEELNRLLRGSAATTFVTVPPAALPELARVRYVITLDSDTRLPRGIAARLVGTMSHPLNRPRYDERAGRVVEGYGIVQPRITPALTGDRGPTLFQWFYSGPCGIDPYAMAVSDVYQDLFQEGTFTGKGIYDVDSFERALAGKVPDASLLSHDLFEGIFARAALASDVELIEEFPGHFEADAARQHRWARGDWQLLPWLIGRGPAAPTSGRPVAIPALGRWKMIDNLRRSLTAPGAFLTLLVAWLAPPLSASVWTLFVVGTIAVPSLLPFLYGLEPRANSISLRSHFGAVLNDLWIGVCRSVLDVTFLAFDTWLMADAIGRTLVRLSISRRNLLQWVTAAQASYAGQYKVLSAYRRMAPGIVLAVASLALVLIVRPSSWPVAMPFVLLWTLSPAVAIGISRPPRVSSDRQLTRDERRFLRSTARRTWRFFEIFLTPENHSLPPDNFQEDPAPVVAHRTSPTNLGVYLLSVLTARDFGWIGTVETVERLEATLTSMARLELYRGHLLNWYDTQDLHPLEPRYVSTVDSGNLAGHLIALAHGCLELIRDPDPGPRMLEGLEDALRLLRSALRSGYGIRAATTLERQLERAIEEFEELLAEPQDTAAGRMRQLADAAVQARAVAELALQRARERGGLAAIELDIWARALIACVDSHARDAAVGAAAALPTRLAQLVRTAERMADAMDFTFLYDRTRKLFSIGFRVANHSLDPSYYDLLASEARLTSFVAIAKGDVPSEHWFRLGRPLTPVGRGSALISWSGSMFEYLMPELVVRSPAASLLSQTCERAVARQIAYGNERGVPWGVSESAYNVRDRALTYQYSGFGVPGLRLQRGASDDIVVAPYATALATMIAPTEAVRNFERLIAVGARGAYGFYDALDYTAARLPPGQDVAIVRTYMAHHQGMTIVALGNAVHRGAMRTRFHAEPIIKATELLLQERTPSDVMVARPRVEEVAAAWQVRALVPPVERRFTTPYGPIPRTQLLSNGRYAVMMTAAGSGYSRWRDLAITRWREDPTLDALGTYFYLRDKKTGRVWSAGHQPWGSDADDYEARFAEDHVTILRRDHGMSTVLEVVVSSEEDAEVRRLCLTNHGARTRDIEVTSYAEICLAPQSADVAHRAFSNLFVETEFVPDHDTLLATRRPRSAVEKRLWAACVIAVEGDTVGPLEYETDRARFVGRGRDLRRPQALRDDNALSNTVGPVLDPILSLRRTVRVPPGRTVRIVLSTLVAEDRDEVLELANKYRDPKVFERAMAWAWTLAQVQLRHLGLQPDEANMFQRLANSLIYSDAAMRPSSQALSRNTLPLSALWSRGISGDRPIVLARIDEEEDVEIIRQLLRAHEYWRMKLLAADVVILIERLPSYDQNLQGALDELVRSSQLKISPDLGGSQGGVFLLRGDLISSEERALLETTARAVVLGRGGSLFEQVSQGPRLDPPLPLPERPARADSGTAVPLPVPELSFFNGTGGFADGGREYVIVLDAGRRTPRPWINVLANPSFGCLVSESGSGFTWSLNSHENRLTPWSNDAVSDPADQAFYLRDEATGEVWTPTALPIRDEQAQYVIHHGQGYSRFRHASRGILVEMTQFVPREDPVRIARLVIENQTAVPRRLSLTGYAEWVLGESRAMPAPHVLTEIDGRTRAMFARSAWAGEFGGRVAFADLGGRQSAWTGDRIEFLGRNGTMARPRALAVDRPLSGRVGAGLDACAALQTVFDLPAGAKTEIVFLLGQAEGRGHAHVLIERYRAADLDAVLREVTDDWDDLLGGITIATPDPAMDLMMNRWLLYQTLGCRVFGRAGFYQAGGAYGFRDQLQDVLALCGTRPAVTRRHILRAASRQFLEGDVQHWWHPPLGRGVRTRISDDLLWLPYAVAHYVESTGDLPVLEESVPFLEGAPLKESEDERYFQPAVSDQRASLYEHCARALDRSLAVGAHGLPLMGTGDWNDGMNRVGNEGKGESVWLAWFLHANLQAFAAWAEARSDRYRAARWRAHMIALQAAVEREAWDGEWYRRAYFDDGTPLGTAADPECRIDSIAQSWGAISGVAPPERARQAMEAVDRELVRRPEGLVLLFTPPFDHTPHDPGYIKGYLPGIRENGGQYTHAATWSVIAFAMLGDGDRAFELFSMLNPITHTSAERDVLRYGTEPYVVAADVYSEPPHVGRAGWTWYTGAAGWLHRAGLESILGLRIRGSKLTLAPSIPRAWPGYSVRLRRGKSTYQVTVENPDHVSRGVRCIELDGASVGKDLEVTLVDDGAQHRVRVVLGSA